MDRQHRRGRPAGERGEGWIAGARAGRFLGVIAALAWMAGAPPALAQPAGPAASTAPGAAAGPAAGSAARPATSAASGREGLTAPLPALPPAGGRPGSGNASVGADAGANSNAGAGAPQAQSCLVEPFQVSEIGSPSPGIVESIEVHRGDVVAEGQTLAVMNRQVDEASLKLRQAEAAYLSRVAGRNTELYKRKLLPAGDYDELTSRSRQAQLQVALQQAILSERVIKSPYAGVVAERYVGQGDRVNDNKLMRLAQIDPLLVKVVVPEAAYGRVRQGDAALVSVNRAIHADPLEAVVWRIDRVMDAASGTFTVLLKMDNPGHAIPAGIRCSVRLAEPGAAGS